MSLQQLPLVFFLQLLVILACCRLVGWLARRWLGQPQVVGEMIAGVLLGPSLFGLWLSQLQQALFPPETRGTLYVMAQLGVGLYMFVVGLGFQRQQLRQQFSQAAAVSVSGMLVPFLLAVLITPWLLQVPALFSQQATALQATLFMGAAMAITAFPMLARIIHERGLSHTPLGTLSLSAGAIDDAAAWCVLAVVLASFGAGHDLAIKAIAGGAVFAAAMIILVPRLLQPIADRAESQNTQSIQPTLMSLVMLVFMLAALIADAIGLHAVFGGFLLGVLMPRGALAQQLKTALEPFTVCLLLPIFFTYSGLNTQLTLVNSPQLLLVCAGVMIVSILGKFGACWAAARLSGQDQRTALGVGALMNARGLMELIIINLGLQACVIGPALFSMLVLMAVATTVMAGPLFDLTQRRWQAALPPAGEALRNG